MRQNAAAPNAIRKQPEIFCWNFTIRRFRSGPLVSNGTERSIKKSSTSSRHSRSRLTSAGAGLLRRAGFGTFALGASLAGGAPIRRWIKSRRTRHQPVVAAAVLRPALVSSPPAARTHPLAALIYSRSNEHLRLLLT